MNKWLFIFGTSWRPLNASNVLLELVSPSSSPPFCFRLQWQRTTYLYTLPLPSEVPLLTRLPTPSERKWMGPWTTGTATVVTAALDARPCQLCEWLTSHLRNVCETEIREREMSRKSLGSRACRVTLVWIRWWKYFTRSLGVEISLGTHVGFDVHYSWCLANREII